MEHIVVRQPVFDRSLDVLGYKVICSRRHLNALGPGDHEEASLKEIEGTFLLIGFDRISGGKKVFIDLTRSLIAGETDLGLPKELVIVEISYAPDSAEALLASCRKLKEAGYVLAAGSFMARREDLLPLAQWVDIIKIRAGEKGIEAPELRKWVLSIGGRTLAEKVNTRGELQLAFDAGHDYFHGHFFSEPVIISEKDIPQYKLTQLRILQEVNRHDMDYSALERVIKQDVSVSYKLLRFINSAFFGLRRHASSIRQALVLLGEQDIRKWTSLVILADLGKNKPPELVVASLIRANFCESLAAKIGMEGKGSEAFLMGLFSMLDVFIGRPLGEIVKEMPLCEEMKMALSGKKNRYRTLLDLVVSYERAELKRFFALASKLKIQEGAVTNLYLTAMDRAEDALQLYGPGRKSSDMH